MHIYNDPVLFCVSVSWGFLLLDVQGELDRISYGSDLDSTTKAVQLFETAHQEISNFRSDVQQCKASKVTILLIIIYSNYI